MTDKEIDSFVDHSDVSKKRTFAHLIRIGVSAIALNQSKYKLSAIGITKGGSLYVGVPRHKTHPYIEEYYSSKTRTIHAECDLILKAAFHNLTHIIVIRLNKQGTEFKLAKPCPHCQKIIEKLHPNAKVLYSTEGGIISFC